MHQEGAVLRGVAQDEVPTKGLWPAARGASGAHLQGETGRVLSLFSFPGHSQHAVNQRKSWRKNKRDGALVKGS